MNTAAICCEPRLGCHDVYRHTPEPLVSVLIEKNVGISNGSSKILYFWLLWQVQEVRNIGFYMISYLMHGGFMPCVLIDRIHTHPELNNFTHIKELHERKKTMGMLAQTFTTRRSQQHG